MKIHVLKGWYLSKDGAINLTPAIQLYYKNCIGIGINFLNFIAFIYIMK